MVEKRNLLFIYLFIFPSRTHRADGARTPLLPRSRAALSSRGAPRHCCRGPGLKRDTNARPKEKKTHKPSTRQSLNILPKEAVCKSFIGTLIMVMLGWIRHAAKKAFCNNFPLQNRAITPGPWKETKIKQKPQKQLRPIFHKGQQVAVAADLYGPALPLPLSQNRQSLPMTSSFTASGASCCPFLSRTAAAQKVTR